MLWDVETQDKTINVTRAHGKQITASVFVPVCFFFCFLYAYWVQHQPKLIASCGYDKKVNFHDISGFLPVKVCVFSSRGLGGEVTWIEG
jgi:hypothetical protein